MTVAPSGDDRLVVGVLISSPLPQLDRLFDYAVPAALASAARFGARVRVRFAGRLTDGFILAEAVGSDIAELSDILAVKGPPVVTSELAALAERVARRYVGLRSDVLRSAVPPRHRRTELSLVDADGQLPPATEIRPLPGDGADGSQHRAGWRGWQQALNAVARREPIRGALAVPAGVDWTTILVEAVTAARAAGRRSIVVLPDAGDVAVALAALAAAIGREHCTRLTADIGPAARYRAYLRALSGDVDVLVGTRAAAFTPMPDLGLLLLWEDAEESLADPQAPYWHAREVIGMRADAQRVPVIMAGRLRTPEVQRLVDIGWARELSPDRGVWRGCGPLIRAPDEFDLARDALALSVRLPRAAVALAKEGLERGSVLVQVGSRGYLPVVACRRCRTPAVCSECGGALALRSSHGIAECGRCGRLAGDWSCLECSDVHLRAVRIGSTRTAEELGRALPSAAVVTSDSDVGVVAEVGPEPTLVIATPGAEPRARAGGYAAGLLLDGDRALARPEFRGQERVLLRWLRAVSLVRERSAGGVVLIVADPTSAVAQATIRADPIGWASGELAVRSEVGLPPARRMVSVTGAPESVPDFVGQVAAKAAELGIELADPLGPVPLDGGRQRWLYQLEHRDAAAVAEVLREVQVNRARGRQSVVTVRVDPLDID